MTQDLLVVKDADKYGYIDENGIAWFNAEFVARGLGFTQTKNGVEYVKWERVKGYLKEFGFSPQVGKTTVDGYFLPEPIVYKLAMKANNEAAVAFQDKLAYEILPSLRKYGIALTDAGAERILTDPDYIIKLAQQVKNARAERDAALAKVAELQPKADYCEKVLVSDEKLTSELIAKEYGKHAEWLNKLLSDLGVIYKRGRNYFLKAAYANRNYRVSDTVTLERGKTVVNHYWTQKGREFIYNLLKNRGTLPVRERQEPMDELF